VDVDITKPHTGFGVIERRQPSSKSTPDRRSSSYPSPDRERAAFTEPVSEGEDEPMDLTPARDEGKRTGLSGDAAAEAIAYREKQLKDVARAGGSPSSSTKGKEVERVNENGRGHPIPHQEREGSSHAMDEHEADERTPLLLVPSSVGSGAIKLSMKPRTLSIDPLAPASAFDETFKNQLRIHEEQERARAEAEQGNSSADMDGEDRILVNEFRAPPGKRIAVPVRVEPKVYFATERTFLVSAFRLRWWRY